MTPRQTRTFEDICRLQTDHCDTKEAWLSVDVGSITIMNQRTGEPSTGQVTLTRHAFGRFVDWYLREQKMRRK